MLIYRPRGRFRRKEIARINQFIQASEVRVISESGEQLGIIPTREAVDRAKELDLDLVEIAPKAKPPVARIMDYGKYRYEQEQKAKQARKKQTIIEVKEIKFRPKIGGGDYGTKKRHVERFLKAGSKVKVTIMFRGREMAHPELGRQILDKLVDDVAEYATVESPPKQDGRNMIMVLGSTVKKLQEKAESKEVGRPESVVGSEKEQKDVKEKKEEKVKQEKEEQIKEEKVKKEVKEVKKVKEEENAKKEDS